jgi:hypothetical protein
MSALLGYVVDILIGAVMEMPEEMVDIKTKSRVLRALNKVIWIQNDLFARHYVQDVDVVGSQAEEGVVKGCNAEARMERRTGGSCPFS